jgi:hypothetical protein
MRRREYTSDHVMIHGVVAECIEEGILEWGPPGYVHRVLVIEDLVGRGEEEFDAVIVC